VSPRKRQAVMFPHPRSHFRSTYATRDVSSLRLIATHHGPGHLGPWPQLPGTPLPVDLLSNGCPLMERGRHWMVCGPHLILANGTPGRAGAGHTSVTGPCDSRLKPTAGSGDGTEE